MSALPVQSPIQRLDFDVLSCIFKINADIFSDRRALETTLATSRVCRDWRNFMLSTSSIWAHLIDFGERHWRVAIAEGRRELIRRNGSALLWMKIPNLHDFSFQGTKFIIDFLADNWQRTQKLQVIIGWTHGHLDLSSQLYLPAPHLESFSIAFTEESSTTNKLFPSLFGGSAPMLRQLRFCGRRSDFTPQPSWLHQLRSLDLTVGLMVSEMLEVLTLTEQLVTLRIDHLRADHTTSTLPLVSLPKLAHLDLNLFGELSPCAVFLDQISIAPACSLTISSCWIHCREIDEESTFASTIQAISSRARPHFTHHVPHQLELKIKAGHFELQTATLSGEPTFKFRVELDLEEGFSANTLAILLNKFTLPSFSKVTSFRFAISGVHRPGPGLTAFIACLPSVHTITVDKRPLRHLIRAQAALKGADKRPEIGFPVLKVLRLGSFLPSPLRRSRLNSASDPLSKFIMARISRGHAITTVDFTKESLPALRDMAFLKKADGLKVLWRQHGSTDILEYVCGTRATRNPVSA